MVYLLILSISLIASVFGAICGIGGGIVIKPVLDSFGIMSVSTISFLSGCTVLCMTLYSVTVNLVSKSIPIRLKTSIPVSAGAAIGGIIGMNCFHLLQDQFENTEFIGGIQAICLGLLTFGTLLYTVNKKKIRTKHIDNATACVTTGLVLGIFSSFLGIGGGPFNLVVLAFLFSMETKEAAQTSLFIILFSQITNLSSAVLAGKIPEFEFPVLIGMACMGIAGGIIGRRINKKIASKTVDKLFVGMTVCIMGICIYNVFRLC